MAPEEAKGLVVLDLHSSGTTLAAEVLRLKCSPREAELPSLEIYWHAKPADEQRNQFWQVGHGAAYVRKTALCDEPERQSAEPEDLGDGRYAWTDFTDAIIAVMPTEFSVVQVFPAAQAKVLGDRLALLWRPEMHNRRVRIEWTLKTDSSDLRADARGINRKFADSYPGVRPDIDRVSEGRRLAKTSDSLGNARSANSDGWDVFISHASEDKRQVADPLYRVLVGMNLKVWYDRTELTIGDSLRKKIDEGLAKCRFGVVILSPAFFAKEWPQIELDGLAARQVQGRKVILPLWHGITYDFLLSKSPILAGLLAAKTSDGLRAAAEQIANVVTGTSASASDPEPN